MTKLIVKDNFRNGGSLGGYNQSKTMKKEFKTLLKSFSIELVLYSIVVFAYFFLVLHFLGASLYHMFKQERTLYATLSLLLIIAQGVVLEYITRGLLRFIRAHRRGLK